MAIKAGGGNGRVDQIKGRGQAFGDTREGVKDLAKKAREG